MKTLTQIISSESLDFIKTINTTEDHQTDISILYSVFPKSISCVYFTHSSMLNPSSSYSFANSPGSHSCSHQMRAPQNANSPFISCSFSDNNYVCPIYKPDYKIIRKELDTKSNIFYYLSSVRSTDCSYSYKIYDSHSNVYVELNYKDIDISFDSSSLDIEAITIFDQFIERASISVQSQNVFSEDKLINSNSSYLSTLFE
jgi:hypothetical protein